MTDQLTRWLQNAAEDPDLVRELAALQQAEDEDGLNGVECGARGGDLPLVAGREGRRGGQNACDQVEEHHGVSPLRW